MFLPPSLPVVNLGTAATLGAHAILAFWGFSHFFPYLAMVLMGIAYSLLACALWPLVAFIVPEDKVATAYGVYVCHVAITQVGII